jgi:hypothetical protein
MDQEIENFIAQILKRFVGMTVSDEVLGYMEMDINESISRVYPDHAKLLHIQPYFEDRKIKFKTHTKH